VRFEAPPRGEIALVLGPVEREPPAARVIDEALRELRAAGLTAKGASSLVARLTGLPGRTLYDQARRAAE
jgi:16S rRNA C1402 (ribose-2'-O) methylase RsmI